MHLPSCWDNGDCLGGKYRAKVLIKKAASVKTLLSAKCDTWHFRRRRHVIIAIYDLIATIL